MARSTFGGTPDARVARRVRVLGYDVDDAEAATLTVWSAQVGGTQHTDLLVGGVAATAVPVDSDGQVPEFQGPDGVAVVWVSANGGTRTKLLPAEGPGDASTAANIEAGPLTQAALADRFASRTSRAKHAVALGIYFPEAEGAVGDGVTNDRAAVQAAITAALAVAASGRQATVYLNPATQFYCNGSLTGGPGIRIQGPGRNGAAGRVIKGNGTDSLFKFGTYPAGSSTANTDVTFTGVTASNAGAPVLELLTVCNWTVDYCDFSTSGFASTDSGTIKARYSYRGVLRNSRITASGGAWAVDLRDNCNGVTIENNIITGGSLGGAVNVGQSQSCHTLRNIIESSMVGIVYSGAGTGSGQCFGCQIDGNYIESVRDAISVGGTYRFAGGSVSNNYIGNSASTFTPTYGIQLGRLAGVKVVNNAHVPKGAEVFIKVLYDAASAGSTPAPEGCTILGNHTTSTLYDLTAYSNVITRAAFAGKNSVSTASDGAQPATGYREWVSDLITANVGLTQTAIALDSTYGGWVDGIDVIDATGTLACTIGVGTSASATEIASLDPSTLTLAQRSASYDLNVGWRAGSTMLVRVVAGAGTGTFRFRVRWHGR